MIVLRRRSKLDKRCERLTRCAVHSKLPVVLVVLGVVSHSQKALDFGKDA